MGIIYQKKRMTLGFKQGKPTVYKAAQAPASKIDFAKLCQEVAASSGMSAAVTKAVVEGLIDRISTFVEEGHTVSLGEFGSFKVVMHVKTQATADEVGADNVRNAVMRFYPGKRFKAMLSDISFSEDVVEYNTVLAPQPQQSSGGSGSGQQTSGNSGGTGGNELGG